MLATQATSSIPALSMTFECAVCDLFYRDTDIADTFTLGDDGAEPVYLCERCASEADDSHKYDSRLALVLWSLSLVGSEDDFMSSEGWGYCGRFGRALLFNDDCGFVTAVTYPSITQAEARFQSLYDDGMGADEDDWYINCGRGGYEVTESLGNGRWQSHTFERLTRARAYYRLKAMREGYYPNLWLTGEHGPTIRRIDY